MDFHFYIWKSNDLSLFVILYLYINILQAVNDLKIPRQVSKARFSLLHWRKGASPVSMIRPRLLLPANAIFPGKCNNQEQLFGEAEFPGKCYS